MEKGKGAAATAEMEKGKGAEGKGGDGKGTKGTGGKYWNRPIGGWHFLKNFRRGLEPPTVPGHEGIEICL